MRFGDGAPIGGGQGEHLAVGVDVRASCFGGVGEEGRGGEQEEKGMLLKHGCTLARARLHWFFCGWWHAVHYVFLFVWGGVELVYGGEEVLLSPFLNWLNFEIRMDSQAFGSRPP